MDGWIDGRMDEWMDRDLMGIKETSAEMPDSPKLKEQDKVKRSKAKAIS